MTQTISGWFFDVYPNEAGLTVWLIGEDGKRYRWTQEFSATIYAAGSARRLRQLWKWLVLQPVPVRLSRAERRDVFQGMVTVLAICCHPDDMEFMMAGTLLLLKQAGCEIHTINLANGCVGSTETGPAETAAIRWKEAQDSARLLGSIHHECMVDDLEVYYTTELIKRVTALVRQVKPDMVFTQSMEDYMDDHMNTAKVAVTATFSRNISPVEMWGMPRACFTMVACVPLPAPGGPIMRSRRPIRRGTLRSSASSAGSRSASWSPEPPQPRSGSRRR